jgi:hypothetical protein
MGCTGVDTSGMDKIECLDCPHYVRKTGATPFLQWLIDLIKTIWRGNTLA